MTDISTISRLVDGFQTNTDLSETGNALLLDNIKIKGGSADNAHYVQFDGTALTTARTITIPNTNINLGTVLHQSLANGNIFIGNASSIATGITMSGDATIVNSGVITLRDLVDGDFDNVNGSAAAGDSIFEVLNKLSANQVDLTTLSGVAQGAVNLGALTADATIIGTTETIHSVVQKLMGAINNAANVHTPIKKWTNNTAYNVGDLLISDVDQRIYEVIAAGTSSGDASDLDGGSDSGVTFREISSGVSAYVDLTDTSDSDYVDKQGFISSVNETTGELDLFIPPHEVTGSLVGAAVGQAIYFNGTVWALAQANNSDTLVSHVIKYVDGDRFIATPLGKITGLSGLTAGQFYFLSDTTAGEMSTVKTSTIGNFVAPVYQALSASEAFVNILRADFIAPPSATLSENIAVGEALSALQVVRYADSAETAGRIYKATASDATASEDFWAIGITNGDQATIGNNVNVIKFGTISGLSGLTVGRPVYLGVTDGTYTQTAPSAVDTAVVRLGIAKSATEIDINIQVISIN